MTDGTSQGLFVVVAIVIFGIFVSLSYTVFGSMGDGLHNLVETATLDAQHLGGEVIYSNEYSEGEAGGNSFGTPTSYSIPSEVFEQDGRYTVNFDIEVTHGNLHAIRGHLHTSSRVTVYIDGVRQAHPQPTSQWRTFAHGFLFDEPYTVGDIVSFRLTFVADNYDEPIQHSMNSFNFSPNQYYPSDGRISYAGDDTMIYRNIEVIKHN